MIRWYDYIIALMAADLIQGLLFASVNTVVWWQPILYGLFAGMVWRAWENGYCAFRLRQEMK